MLDHHTWHIFVLFFVVHIRSFIFCSNIITKFQRLSDQRAVGMSECDFDIVGQSIVHCGVEGTKAGMAAFSYYLDNRTCRLHCANGDLRPVSSPGWNLFKHPEDSFKCPAGFAGNLPDPYDCAKYHKCFFGRDTVERCPTGRLFHKISKQCHWEYNVTC